MKPVYRLLVAAVTVLGMYLSFAHGIHANNAGLVTRLTNYFSFFTISTNTIVVLAMLLPVVTPGSGAGKFFSRPGVRTAVAGYIIIVGGVYHVMLAPLWSPEGLNLAAQIILHYAAPVAFTADWLAFVERGKMRWANWLTALIYPVMYVLWTLVHGEITGFYPYPFLDIDERGYAQVLINISILVAAFLIVQLLLVTLDKVLAGGRSNRMRPTGG